MWQQKMLDLDQTKQDILAILNHVKMRDMSVPRRHGIGGAHNQIEFAQYKGTEYQVEKETPHPVVPGVSIIQYRMYKANRDGSINVGNPQAKIFTKTVYDPSVWTDEKLVKAAVEAAMDAANKDNFKREWSGNTAEGYPIMGYQEKGKITTFFFSE